MKEARQFEDENIDCFITIREFERLNRFVDFLPCHQYQSSDSPAKGELGKIGIMGGPIIRFHLKKTAINPTVLLNLLEEVEAIGSTRPQEAMQNLKNVIKFLKEKT